jgi:hypothetical protein
MKVTALGNGAPGPRRVSRWLVGALAGVLAAAGTVIALPAAAAGSDSDTAYVRAAHLVPDLPAMDVTLSRFAGDGPQGPSAPLLTITAAYGDVGAYAPVQPGFYAVALRPAGAPADSAPVLTGTFRAEPGRSYTGAGVGTASNASLAFFQDDLSAPGEGKARIRVVNAARNADPVDVSAVGGPPVAAGTAYAQSTTYATVPAQAWELRAQGGPLSGTATTSLASNAVYTLLVLESGPQALTVRPVLDASGAGQVPVGGAATGLGGSALAADTGPAPATGSSVLQALPGWALPTSVAIVVATLVAMVVAGLVAVAPGAGRAGRPAAGNERAAGGHVARRRP